MDDETRGYFDAFRRELVGLRGDFGEMRRDFVALDRRVETLDGKVEILDGKVETLDGKVNTLDRRVDALGRKIDATAEETRRHFDVVGEALHDDIRTVAEAVAANTEGISRLRSDVYREMETRFGAVNAAFAEVRRDIEDIRTRL